MDKEGCEVSLAKDMQGKLPHPYALCKLFRIVWSAGQLSGMTEYAGSLAWHVR